MHMCIINIYNIYILVGKRMVNAMEKSSQNKKKKKNCKRMSISQGLQFEVGGTQVGGIV